MKSTTLAFVALHTAAVLGWHPLHRRDGNERFPFCTPNSDPDYCINGGKYVKPDLNISEEDSAGNQAYVTYLPTHTYTLSQWTNNKIPAVVSGSIAFDGFQLADFTVYNVTYSDCLNSPWVIVRHSSASKTIAQLADVISKIPASVRQATSIYLVYPESHKGAIGALSGYLVGKGSYYFPTALIHEHGHSVDGFLVSPNPTVSSYSGTDTWRTAVTQDGFTVTAYGTTSHAENFADVGRVVLINNIYPGGIAGLFPNHPNLTQINRQVNLFTTIAGSYYRNGNTCDTAKKYPYPTAFVDKPVSSTTQPPTATATATATAYGQCGGWSTYTGPTACGAGWTCTTLNPYYAQCTPTP